MPQLNAGATFWVSHLDHAIRDSWYSDGLYSADTRYISKWQLLVNDKEPFSLAYNMFRHDHSQWVLVAPALITSSDGIPTEASITLNRFVKDGLLHEDISVNAFGTVPVIMSMSLTISTDFADLFEVRRQQWQSRQVKTVWDSGEHRLVAEYQNKQFYRSRVTDIESDTTPTVNGGNIGFSITLSPGESWHACIEHHLLTAKGDPPALGECPLTVWNRERQSVTDHKPSNLPLPEGVPKYRVANAEWQVALDQSVRDLEALRIPNPAGSEFDEIPAAGIPWFVALFGRDSVIASLQTLIHHPAYMRGTIAALAAFQSTKHDAFRDAEPGKICHELRVGEWAEFGLIPHNPYYGSADATALFLHLVGTAYQWGADPEWLLTYREAVDKALMWVDTYGDTDHDGFQEYGPRAMTGYPNQCWRDSPDGVPDEEGHTPSHPIGTSELQAYVYAAKCSLAPLFEAWGDAPGAARLRDEAAMLRQRFHEVFWIEKEETLALCIDGRKHPVASVASDSGHCLWMDFLDEKVAASTARQLLSPELFSGWGIRTLSTAHPAYDPHSYHRGSVWPHDSMIAAAGLMRYGFVDEAWLVMRGIIAAAGHFPNTQIPEVFSGIDRSIIPVPVPYRRPNVPQAWAAGSIIQAVHIALGIDPHLPSHEIHFTPHLPEWCPTISITGLVIGDTTLSVEAQREPDGSSSLAATVESGTRYDLVVHDSKMPARA